LASLPSSVKRPCGLGRRRCERGDVVSENEEEEEEDSVYNEKYKQETNIQTNQSRNT
jgi:hypothetical protein